MAGFVPFFSTFLYTDMTEDTDFFEAESVPSVFSVYLNRHLIKIPVTHSISIPTSTPLKMAPGMGSFAVSF